MDHFYQTFLAVLLASLGDAPQLLAAACAMHFARTREVLTGVILACTLNVIISVGAGASMRGSVDVGTAGRLFLLLQAVAFAGAGLSMLLFKPRVRIPKPGKWGVVFTVFVTIAALQLLDKGQFLIAAFTARSGQPGIVALAGWLALMLAIVPAVLLKERLGRILPLALIRRISGGVFVLAAGYFAARAFGYV